MSLFIQYFKFYQYSNLALPTSSSVMKCIFKIFYVTNVSIWIMSLSP